jgi:bile acid:Na+ symporter, BASS family
MNTSALLFLVVIISMAIGVFLPQFSKVFAPYLLIWLGALLFLNLIQLEASDLVSAFARPKNIVLLSLIKLVVLPLVLYASTLVIYPSLALSVLLVSGISTGLGAPFVANFLGSNFTLIVGVIIVTSLAVPFVLPPIVHLLIGSHFSIPLTQMIVLLAAALFTPFLAGWVTKRFSTKAAKYVSKNSLYFSIVLIMLINMAVFSKISIYFFESPIYVIEMTLIAFLLFGVYGTVGYTLTLVVSCEKKSITNESKSNTRYGRTCTAATEGLIAMAYVNNILIAVFAEQFFGIQCAVLPALYNIPYYIGIIILKKLYSVQVLK